MADNKVVLDLPLKFVKSTDGTYVFDNKDMGLGKIYVPKPFLVGKVDAPNAKLRLQIVEDK